MIDADACALRFEARVPPDMATRLVQNRMTDPAAVEAVILEPLHVVISE